MAIEWWHWAVLGFVLVIAELLMPAFLLLWFGVAALMVGSLLWLFPALGVPVQVVLLAVFSAALIGAWFKLVKPNRHKTRLGMSDANIIGEVGLLIEDVAPFQRGKVRFQRPMVGADVWECIADESIASGARVKVSSIEGSLVKIVKGISHAAFGPQIRTKGESFTRMWGRGGGMSNVCDRSLHASCLERSSVRAGKPALN